MLYFALAWRDLMHDRVYLLCNVAMICGVLVPLLVLHGVKSGVYSALTLDIASDPDALLVATLGDEELSEADVAEVSSWPETGFVVPRTRNIGGLVLVQNSEGGLIREAFTVPSAEGDPLLEGLAAPSGRHVVLSHLLAEVTNLAAEDHLRIIVRSEARPLPMLIEAEVAGILPREKMSGVAIFLDTVRLEAIEAYYEGYSLPAYGVLDGRDISRRAIVHEGLRLYATDLSAVGKLERRLVERFDISTRSQANQIARVERLGRNLNLALLVIATSASVGLAAALVFGFWADVQRKRQVLATLALIGFAPGEIARLPVLQAAITGFFALGIAVPLFLLVAELTQLLFAHSLGEGQRLVVFPLYHALAAAAITLSSVVASATWATRAALRTDPAVVFRS